MERLAELLFILASIDRLTLLSEIAIKNRGLSQLTTNLSATPQETSKHLTRLRDAKLIEKGSDGFFATTGMGIFEVMIRLMVLSYFVALVLSACCDSSRSLFACSCPVTGSNSFGSSKPT